MSMAMERVNSAPADVGEATATAVKKSWAAVVRRAEAHRDKAVRVLAHGRAQAWVVSPERYEEMRAAERSREQRIEARLHTLRAELDQRQQVLDTPEGEAALRHAFDEPARLEGSVIAGASQ
jgi:PHD/YefM family antitoxin component YafN of YafNO toxin-antitoxin module